MSWPDRATAYLCLPNGECVKPGDKITLEFTFNSLRLLSGEDSWLISVCCAKTGQYHLFVPAQLGMSVKEKESG